MQPRGFDTGPSRGETTVPDRASDSPDSQWRRLITGLRDIPPPRDIPRDPRADEGHVWWPDDREVDADVDMEDVIQESDDDTYDRMSMSSRTMSISSDNPSIDSHPYSPIPYGQFNSSSSNSSATVTRGGSEDTERIDDPFGQENDATALDDEGLENDEAQGEGDDEGHDGVPQFDPSAMGLKEISNLASFTVSSSKPGCGVKELRDDDVNQFWQ